MNLYVSYTHHAKDLVHKLVGDLRQQGMTVWLGEEMVAAGDPWAEKLNHAIEKSDAVLVVISRGSSESQWQTSEIAFAIADQKENAAKRLIPVLAEKGAEIPFFLKGLLYCDLSDPSTYERNLAELLRGIERPQSEQLESAQVHRLRIETLKAGRALLQQEQETLARNRAMRMASVSWMLITAVVGTTTLLGLFVAGLAWNHSEIGVIGVGGARWSDGMLDFVAGALAGVSAALAAVLVSSLLYRRATRSRGQDAQ